MTGPRSPGAGQAQEEAQSPAGGMVGLVAGMGLAFFLEYLDNTIKLPEDVTDFLKVPYLGPVPAFTMNGASEDIPAELISVHSPKSTASEAYRGLRTSLLLSSADKKPRVIMVTSAGPLEGKTLTSSNMAVIMARSHQSVFLIDGDMRRPRVHKVFQTATKKGLSVSLWERTRWPMRLSRHR